MERQEQPNGQGGRGKPGEVGSLDSQQGGIGRGAVNVSGATAFSRGDGQQLKGASGHEFRAGVKSGSTARFNGRVKPSKNERGFARTTSLKPRKSPAVVPLVGKQSAAASRSGGTVDDDNGKQPRLFSGGLSSKGGARDHPSSVGPPPRRNHVKKHIGSSKGGAAAISPQEHIISGNQSGGANSVTGEFMRGPMAQRSSTPGPPPPRQVSSQDCFQDQSLPHFGRHHQRTGSGGSSLQVVPPPTDMSNRLGNVNLRLKTTKPAPFGAKEGGFAPRFARQSAPQTRHLRYQQPLQPPTGGPSPFRRHNPQRSDVPHTNAADMKNFETFGDDAWIDTNEEWQMETNAIRMLEEFKRGGRKQPRSNITQDAPHHSGCLEDQNIISDVKLADTTDDPSDIVAVEAPDLTSVNSCIPPNAAPAGTTLTVPGNRRHGDAVILSFLNSPHLDSNGPDVFGFTNDSNASVLLGQPPAGPRPELLGRGPPVFYQTPLQILKGSSVNYQVPPVILSGPPNVNPHSMAQTVPQIGVEPTAIDPGGLDLPEQLRFPDSHSTLQGDIHGDDEERIELGPEIPSDAPAGNNLSRPRRRQRPGDSNLSRSAAVSVDAAAAGNRSMSLEWRGGPRPLTAEDRRRLIEGRAASLTGWIEPPSVRVSMNDFKKPWMAASEKNLVKKLHNQQIERSLLMSSQSQPPITANTVRAPLLYGATGGGTSARSSVAPLPRAALWMVPACLTGRHECFQRTFEGKTSCFCGPLKLCPYLGSPPCGSDICLEIMEEEVQALQIRVESGMTLLGHLSEVYAVSSVDQNEKNGDPTSVDLRVSSGSAEPPLLTLSDKSVETEMAELFRLVTGVQCPSAVPEETVPTTSVSSAASASSSSASLSEKMSPVGQHGKKSSSLLIWPARMVEVVSANLERLVWIDKGLRLVSGSWLACLTTPRYSPALFVAALFRSFNYLAVVTVSSETSLFYELFAPPLERCVSARHYVAADAEFPGGLNRRRNQPVPGPTMHNLLNQAAAKALTANKVKSDASSPPCQAHLFRHFLLATVTLATIGESFAGTDSGLATEVGPNAATEQTSPEENALRQTRHRFAHYLIKLLLLGYIEALTLPPPTELNGQPHLGGAGILCRDKDFAINFFQYGRAADGGPAETSGLGNIGSVSRLLQCFFVPSPLAEALLSSGPFLSLMSLVFCLLPPSHTSYLSERDSELIVQTILRDGILKLLHPGEIIDGIRTRSANIGGTTTTTALMRDQDPETDDRSMVYIWMAILCEAAVSKILCHPEVSARLEFYASNPSAAAAAAPSRGLLRARRRSSGDDEDTEWQRSRVALIIAMAPLLPVVNFLFILIQKGSSDCLIAAIFKLVAEHHHTNPAAFLMVLHDMFPTDHYEPV